MLSAFTRKFGHAGFFTIYQDCAMRNIGLTLAELGLSGPIYGSTAMAGVVTVTISHVLRWQYSKIISLIVSSTLNAVLIIILTVAVGEVRDDNIITLYGQTIVLVSGIKTQDFCLGTNHDITFRKEERRAFN